jgi:hypothetical protein
MIFKDQTVKFKDKTLYEFANMPKIEVDVYDQYHYTNFPTRLDSLANMYYDDPGKWWIIANANDKWGVSVIPAGESIRIPSKNRIISIQRMMDKENEY